MLCLWVPENYVTLSDLGILVDQAAEPVPKQNARALAVKADSAVPEALIAAVDESAGTFGALNILVNNAAVFLTGPLQEMGRPEIDRTLAVNVRAPLMASQAAVRHMDGGGRIVNIGSNVAGRHRVMTTTASAANSAPTWR